MRLRSEVALAVLALLAGLLAARAQDVPAGPADLEAPREEAAALLAAGRTDDALAVWERAREAATAAGDEPTTATCFHESGRILLDAGRVPAALDAHAEALSIRRRVLPPDAADLGLSLNATAYALELLGRSAEALPLWEENLALTVRQDPEDDPEIASSLANLGYSLLALGRPAEALARYEEALALRQRPEASDDAAIAATLNDIGNCLTALGRGTEAVARHEEALALRRRRFPGDHADVAQSLNSLGHCLEAQGRAAEALPRFEEAAAVFRRVHGGDHEQVAGVLNNLAHCLQTLGRVDEALPLLEESLAMFRRLQGETHPDVATSTNNVAGCLQDLGRDAEALALYEQGLEIRRRIFTGDHPDLAQSFNNIATTLESLGRAAEALTLHEQALAMRQRLFPGDHPHVVMSLSNLGGCLQTLGRADEAVPIIEEALAMWARLSPYDHYGRATGLTNLAFCLDVLGRHEESLLRHDAAVAMFERLYAADHSDLASSLNNRGACHQAAGRRAEALADYGRALAMLQRLYPADHPYVAHSLVNVARVELELDEPQRALPLLEEATAMLSRLRVAASSLDELDRSRYFAELKGDAFTVLRRARLALGDAAGAWQAAEDGRGLVLLDLLARSRFDPLAEAEALAHRRADERAVAEAVSVRAELRTAEGEVNRLVRAVADEGGETSLPGAEREARLAGLKAALAAADQRRRDAIRARARLIADVVPVGQVAAADEVRAALEDGELLLCWALDERESLLFVVDRDGVDAVPLDATLSSVARDGQRFLDWLSRSGTEATRGLTSGPRANADMPAVARPLREALLPDAVWERVRTARRVIAVPDGPLQRLPLEALVVGPPDAPRTWLDDGPPIAYVPSSTVLLWCRERARSRQPAAELDVLALGDATFTAAEPPANRLPAGRPPADVPPAIEPSAAEPSRADAARVDLLDHVGPLQPLPATRREVAAITEAFERAGPERRVRALLGAQATEADLFRLAPQARYLHLATHGLADEVEGASFSMLALSRPAVIGPDDDGFLTLADLLERWPGRLPLAPLVVLSACRTQVGPQQQDEAPHALPLGFICAGASAVVASQWSVADASTAELMADFYRRLAQAAAAGGAVDRLAAFTAARRALVERRPDPYHWAAFVFIGSPD